MAIVLLALLTGCQPQDAEVTAHWFTWLAANSSPTVAEGKLDETFADQATAIECSGRGWDPEEDRFENGYIGPGSDLAAAASYVGGACDPDDGNCDEDELSAECAGIDDLYFHTFLQDDGSYFLQGELEPYRTEAYINSENDFQLTVHQALENREDFRFHFTIAPDFAPVDCVADESGTTTIEYVDGAKWTEEWSVDEDGYTIYYLNAGTYQRNPSNTEDYWYLVTDWLSGFGEAKFAAEEFASIATAYGDYEHLESYELSPSSANYRAPLLNNSGHFLAVNNRESFDDAEYAENIELLSAYADSWADELNLVAGATSGDYSFEHKVEDNQWREIDIQASGIDGWMEVHSSWVRIKNGATFELGTAVEGDFQILYQGIESGSRLLVKGSFKVDKLREDPWGYSFLESDKRDENGTPYCGGAAWPE